MTSILTRMGTANAYDAGIRQINQRQTSLSNLQAQLTSGKRVVQASDDPTSAGAAERALTRLNRIAVEQRALESQRNAITQGEAVLGDVTSALQRFHELVVNAGNGIHSSTERADIVQELQGLRDEVLALANRTDTNGQPLFGALGSTQTPFTGPNSAALDYTFNGLPGTTGSTQVTIPYALDGQAAFMLNPAQDKLTPTAPNSVFGVMDMAIRDLSAAPTSAAATPAVQEALTNLDACLARITAVRGQAGALLNRVDRISANQDLRGEQLNKDRSRAEDLDMVQGISDFQNQQTGYQAALQAYAKIQQLSLFNYLG